MKRRSVIAGVAAVGAAAAAGLYRFTDLFVKRYGVPPIGRAIFIRTRQHVNGWSDPPKQVRAVFRAA